LHNIASIEGISMAKIVGNDLVAIGLYGFKGIFHKGLSTFIDEHKDYSILFDITTNHIQLKHKLKAINEAPKVILVDFDESWDSSYTSHVISDIKLFTKHFPSCNIITVLSKNNSELIFELIDNEIKGFLLKDCTQEDLENAIKSIILNGAFIGHFFWQTIQTGFQVENKSVTKTILTTREIEIVKLICMQLKASEIADKLFLSEKTINIHKHHILSKTNSKNSVGIVLYALKNGLVKL